MASLTSILEQKRLKNKLYRFPSDAVLSHISCDEGRPGTIFFTNGKNCQSKCLGCKTKPCLFYSHEEIKSEKFFKAFPADADNRVCASNAIQWDGKP